MGRIIRLHGDPHEQAETLLPWYAVGGLDPVDRAKLEAHLADCAGCRAELERDHRLRAAIKALPLDSEAGWAGLRSRLEAGERPRADVKGRRWPIWRAGAEPRRLGWFLAAQTALVLVLAVAATPGETPALYRTLGRAPAGPAGNVIVIFRPDTREADLRNTLNAVGARLIDGPTAADAYVLQVPAGHRAAVLTSLRKRHEIVVAEPVDPRPAS
jgi:anti-sigma factor RsiW